MTKAIFGQVKSIKEASKDGCKCNFTDAELYVENFDIIYDIKNSDSVRYTSFPVIYKELKTISFGGYFEGSKEYEKLKNFCSKSVLDKFYKSYNSIYLETCYSEWTCGEPGQREFIRINELKNLKGRYVIFLFD